MQYTWLKRLKKNETYTLSFYRLLVQDNCYNRKRKKTAARRNEHKKRA